jgi:hypothetical protein
MAPTITPNKKGLKAEPGCAVFFCLERLPDDFE